MKTALDNIKELDVQVRQWQGRLDFAKAENDRLVKHSELLKQEDKNIRATLEQDAARKLADIHEETKKLNALKEVFESQKNEFLATLTAFKQDRNIFEREKQTVLDMKKDSQALIDKAGAFIRLVRSAAEGL